MANVQPQLENDARAVEAYFNKQTRSIVLRLQGGTILNLPVNKLQGLANASDSDIAGVELMPQGAALHWENLDLDFSIAGLAAGVFGTRAWMAELGRKGGSVKSFAKASAAKTNGQKGGRPRKVQVPATPNTKCVQAIPLKGDNEFLDTDLSDQSHMATEAVVKYEGIVVAGYQALMRQLQVEQTESVASLSPGAGRPNLKASVKLPDNQIQDWAKGAEDAELPIAA